MNYLTYRKVIEVVIVFNFVEMIDSRLKFASPRSHYKLLYDPTYDYNTPDFWGWSSICAGEVFTFYHHGLRKLKMRN